MKETRRRFFQILLLLLLVSAVNCYAQFSGGVQGTVQDSNGSVIPNATVTLINAATGVKQWSLGGYSNCGCNFSNGQFQRNIAILIGSQIE